MRYLALRGIWIGSAMGVCPNLMGVCLTYHGGPPLSAPHGNGPRRTLRPPRADLDSAAVEMHSPGPRANSSRPLRVPPRRPAGRAVRAEARAGQHGTGPGRPARPPRPGRGSAAPRLGGPASPCDGGSHAARAIRRCKMGFSGGAGLFLRACWLREGVSLVGLGFFSRNQPSHLLVMVGHGAGRSRLQFATGLGKE